MAEVDEKAQEWVLSMLLSGYADMEASDLAKRMNAGMSAQECVRRLLKTMVPEAISAYRAALPTSRLSALHDEAPALRERVKVLEGALVALNDWHMPIMQSLYISTTADGADFEYWSRLSDQMRADFKHAQSLISQAAPRTALQDRPDEPQDTAT